MAGTAEAKRIGMRIQFRTLPVSKHLNGWRRVIRRVKNILRGTLIVDFGRITLEFAN
jgi:hypothetical protein